MNWHAQVLPFPDEISYQQAFEELNKTTVAPASVKAQTLTGVKAKEKYSDKQNEYEVAQNIIPEADSGKLAEEKPVNVSNPKRK